MRSLRWRKCGSLRLALNRTAPQSFSRNEARVSPSTLSRCVAGLCPRLLVALQVGERSIGVWFPEVSVTPRSRAHASKAFWANSGALAGIRLPKMPLE